MTQFPHLKSDIISHSLPVSQSDCGRGRWQKLPSEQTLHCLAGFLASPSQTRPVSFCKVPGDLVLARPSVRVALLEGSVGSQLCLGPNHSTCTPRP